MSPRKPKGPSLPQERQRTDKSLRAEREKADEKLESVTARTEDRTDQEVVETRIGADEMRRRQRAKADQAATVVQKGAKGDQGVEHVVSQIQDARRAEDEALKAERESVDEALEHEREHRSTSVKQFLRTERSATDQNLTHERETADEAVQRAVSVRSENAAALDATRSALLTRDDFLAIIGHDLKNPLIAIATAAESLSTQASHPGATEHVRKQTDSITTNARDALRLLNDLLERVAVWQGPADR